MEIEELHLKHYGKFEDYRIRLNSGVNVIYGGNEAGKTTIHSFIRAMLFGLGRGRGRAGKRDEYQIRQPWEHSGLFSGSMVVREGGVTYRIDRNFDSRSAELQVTDITAEQELPDPEQAVAKLLGGIGEAAFQNTVFIRQAKAETDEALAEELRRCMVNGENRTDLNLDVTAALQTLRKRKKQAEQKKKKEEEALESQIEKKQTEAEYLRRETRMLNDQLEFLRHPHRQNLRRRSAAGYTEPKNEETEDDLTEPLFGEWFLQILLVFAGVLCIIGAFTLEGQAVRYFLGIFSVVFLGIFLLLHGRMKKEVEEDDEAELTSESRERAARLQSEIAKREDAVSRLKDELEVLYQNQVRLEASETEIAALNLAIDRICELTVGIYEKSGGTLNQRASQILSELTNGRYDRIVMDETGEIRLHTSDRVLSLHQVSHGTIQQIYFAVRIAAGEMLEKDVTLPLILDEPFVQYDEERLTAVLSWLQKSGRQVLLFTCQKREHEILERLRTAPSHRAPLVSR